MKLDTAAIATPFQTGFLHHLGYAVALSTRALASANLIDCETFGGNTFGRCISIMGTVITLHIGREFL